MADDHRMLIGGGWVASESGATFDATSPSTGEVIAGQYLDLLEQQRVEGVLITPVDPADDGSDSQPTDTPPPADTPPVDDPTDGPVATEPDVVFAVHRGADR